MVLERARKLKNVESAEKTKAQDDVALRVREMLEKHGGPVKMEVDDEGEPVVPEEEEDPNTVVIDATREYCRNVGMIFLIFLMKIQVGLPHMVSLATVRMQSTLQS